MGIMPVKKLIVTMSLPMMISMLVQALYNIVDSIFVARLSEDALTAVTLAFPLQNLMIAVASGTGVGVNALLSKSLGEKRFDRSDKAANTAIFLSFCNFAIFALIGMTLSAAFIHSQTQDAVVAGYGITYLRIVMGLSLGISFQIMLERLLQSTGRTVYSMASQLTGAIINIILDPIMIFGLFGCPAFGVAGAAYATVIGQTIAATIGLILNLRYNADIRISMSSILQPNAKIIGRIYQVGVPSILMMAIGSLMTYMMNRILIGFSNTATAVFGVYFKLQSFFFMPIFGLNNGLIPVLAYNYGARNKSRIDEALKFSVALAVCIRYESNRRAGASYHKPALSDCSSVHCYGVYFSGLFQKHILSCYIRDKTAPGSYSCGLAAGENRHRDERLVRISDCRGSIADNFCNLL